MVIHYLNKLDESARQTVLKNDGRSLDITVVSINLQTGTNINQLGAEDKHILDTKESFEYYNQLFDGSGKLIYNDSPSFTLTLKNQQKTLSPKIQIILFNFGVNAAHNLKTGVKLQNEINNVGFLKLQAIYEDYQTDYKKANNKNDLVAANLWYQIEDVMKNGGTAYELPARIANLAFRMGILVHFNCKSGKDRTGLEDVEAKFLAQQIYGVHNNQAVPTYQNVFKKDSLEKSMYRQLLFESGNLEVQAKNTGAPGYKVATFLADLAEPDLKSRIGKVLPLVQGFEKYTEVQQTY